MMLRQLLQAAKDLLIRPPVALPPVLGAVMYAAFHRTPQEAMEQSLPIATFLAIIAYGFFLTRWLLFRRPKFSAQYFLVLTVYLPIVIAVSTAVYYGLWVALLDGYKWFQHQSPPRYSYLAIITALLVAFGYALFLFRLHARFFFGVTESLVGVLVALHNVPTNADPVNWSSSVFIVMLTAGVFLLVRGFDNMHTGLNSAGGDAILRAVSSSEYGSYLREIRGRCDES